MGLLDGLGRFVWGENEPEGMTQRSDAPQVPSSNTQPQQPPLVDEHGYKIIPHITLDHVKAHRNGDTMIVTAWVANHSEHNVRIDECHVLGQKQILQRPLSPNAGHEVTVYKGPVALNEYDSHAGLIFRTFMVEKPDQFENVYHVEFNRESDGKFTIEEFHEDGPVHDI
jgi:hypothetical protein